VTASTRTRSPTPSRLTVGRLRRKLGAPPVITTVPTVGYRIAEPER
jgi:DNA-binding response OmpR family regulator